MALAEKETDITALMTAVTGEAEASLNRTPELLPVLKEVGVVDSGGKGLLCVYEGFLASLKVKLCLRKQFFRHLTTWSAQSITRARKA